MKKNILVLFIIFWSLVLIPNDFAFGFGVSPPYINSQILKPGSRFESTVYLSRSDLFSDAIAEVSIDDSEISSWITIKQGKSFILPKDEKLVPMTVIIDVPSDAEYKNYLGYIRVISLPMTETKEKGQVAIVSGARIDLNLTVTEKGFPDFKIKGVNVPNFEKGDNFVFLMILDNTGNVRIRPSKVKVDIYDLNREKIIAGGEVTEMDFVEPFQSRQIQGSFPVDIEVGEYWADITVYKEELPAGDPFKVFFKVVPQGTLREKELEEKGLSFSDYKLGLITILMVVMVMIWINKDKIKLFLKKRKR